mmetsp:Transcript_23608/g.54980  ORF Transcript_23608/g.54980 Transcript_23608/m.54980 type:complete len:453 (-) Transcript_23608:186-1544(-)
MAPMLQRGASEVASGVVAVVALLCLTVVVVDWQGALEGSDTDTAGATAQGLHRRIGRRLLEEEERPNAAQKLHYGTPEAPFAETALEFKYHLKEVVKAQGGFASEPELGKYTKWDVEDMMRATRVANDVQEGFWRKSGKTALNHGIGTGSCMLMTKAPAAYVNVAILHGTYFAYWRAYKLGKSTFPGFEEDVCPRRRYVEKAVSKTTERALWRYYSVYSGNPQPTDPALWNELFDNKTLPIMDKHMLLFDICDDVEQFQHDEQFFNNNDKNHKRPYVKNMKIFLNRLEKDPDMQHLDLKLLKKYVRRVQDQVEDWYFKSPEKYTEQFKIRDTLELAYRNAGDTVVIGFAHIEHVRHSILWCRKPIHFAECLEHWEDIRDYWEEACCDRGGPCTRHGGPERYQALPLADIGLPPAFPEKLLPKLTPATMGKTKESLAHGRDVFGDYAPPKKKL